ncbi:MAG TPA: hypothetical protein VFI08_11840 [Spirochaetia bacterium]|nr:hypothetical protein [Spirochaetia bacterium]
MTAAATRSFELYSRELCSGGAFFPVEVPLPAGARVKLTLYIEIAALEQFKGLPNRAKITTQAPVIRSDKIGMALKFAGPYSMLPALS